MASRPSVVIVGGGIGGLFAANALIAQGLRVAVYEQAQALGEIGAGVFLTPNAVRHLERVGFGPAVEKWGARVGSGSRYFRHDGIPIAPVQVTDATGWNATFGMHRADFVAFLAGNLPAGIVHTGHRAVGFEQDDHRARVDFANGVTVEADVVVAADGIHSALRPHVFPPSDPVFHGTISYRGLVPRERLPNWPMDRWQMWAGPSRHFLVFPVRHGTMVNYVGFVPTDEQMKESWSAPGDPELLRGAFDGWDARVGEDGGEGHAVLDRLVRALAEVGQHRMRRVPEQGETALGPGRERLAVVECPTECLVDLFQHLRDARIPAVEFTDRKSTRLNSSHG